MKTEKPFGLWKSPISAQTLGQRMRLDDVQWDSDGQTIVWLEGRSDRTQLVAQQNGDAGETCWMALHRAAVSVTAAANLPSAARR